MIKKNNFPKMNLLFFAFSFIIFLLALGTVLFSYLEGWGLIDSLYFSTMTLTTIGYGDFVPTTDISKILTSLFALLGVGTFLFALGIISEYHMHKRLLNIKDYSYIFKGTIKSEVNKKVTDLRTVHRAHKKRKK